MSEKMLEDMNIDLHDSPGVLPNEKDFVEGTGDSYAIYQKTIRFCLHGFLSLINPSARTAMRWFIPVLSPMNPATMTL